MAHQNSITGLPDNVLDHILGLLPTTDSVNVLLHRPFNSFWASSLKTLVFDSRDPRFAADHENRRFTNFVNQILARVNRSEIERFELKFGNALFVSPDSGDRIDDRGSFLSHWTSTTVDSWLAFVLGKKVRVLDVGILQDANINNFPFYYEFPRFVLQSHSLEELNLFNVGLGKLGRLGTVELVNVRRISLASVRLGVSVVDSILESCLRLESFELHRCNGMELIHEIRLGSRMLKFLTVNFGTITTERPMAISGDNLVGLNLAGGIGYFAVENAPCLSEVSLKICGGRAKIFRIGADMRLMESLNGIKKLTLSAHSYLETLCDLPPENSDWPSYKTLVLKGVFAERHIPAVCWWLKNTVELEHLSVYNQGDTDHIFADRDCDYIEWPYCLQYHLKTLKLFGRMTSPFVEFLRYVVRDARMLEEVVISTRWDGGSDTPDREMPRELRELSRAMPHWRKGSHRLVMRYRW